MDMPEIDLTDAIALLNEALELYHYGTPITEGSAWDRWAAAAHIWFAGLAREGCNDAAGSEVAQVRRGLDLPDQSQSNS